MTSRVNRRAAHMAALATRSGFDAAITIAARTPILFAQGFNPTADSTRETHQMVQEKVSAMFEGAMAAQKAWANFFVRAAFGGVRTADDVSLGMASVAGAALRPAQRSVRANAKRLTRKAIAFP